MHKNINLTRLQQEIPSALSGAQDGLPDEVFNFIASVTAMVNVDLLVYEPDKGFLLSWRKDGGAWHIPGGIIRFKETLFERLVKTGKTELRAEITFDATPLKISEIFMPCQWRGHFISFLYRVYLPSGYTVNNAGKTEGEDGFLAWHKEVPVMIKGQDCYLDFMHDFLAKQKQDQERI